MRLSVPTHFLFDLRTKKLVPLSQKQKGRWPSCQRCRVQILNHSKFSWRRFLLSISASTISKVSALTGNQRPKVFIIDDSSFYRNRSKKVELLARCFDHASQKMRFYKGFRMLTLGWSDGATFIPLDFSLLSSKTAQINGISEHIDKRCSGYKRRLEALHNSLLFSPSLNRALM